MHTVSDKRIDLHTHTLLSDGELVPSELIRRAAAKGFEALAITDHADETNYEYLISRLRSLADSSSFSDITVLCGIELTHVPPAAIRPLAQKARKLGADIIVVHGETPVEPVAPGTNRAALEAGGYVDILAHPGFITAEEAALAARNGIYLEITSRSGHNWTNGHVVTTGRAAGAAFVINTDTHRPGDLISSEEAFKVALGAGLSEAEAYTALNDNPRRVLERLRNKL